MGIESLLQTLNARVGIVRREILNERAYLVAPFTSLVPGVLNGSKGALFYPPSEIANHPGLWNGFPITVGHPADPMSGMPQSARQPHVANRVQLGVIYNDDVSNGERKGEAWFDEQLTRDRAPAIYNRLNKAYKGQAVPAIELSTGLYTENVPAHNGATWNGKPYDAIATNYQPDHLAVFEPGTQKGACSVGDGCGVLNSNPEGINQYTWLAHAAELASTRAERASEEADDGGGRAEHGKAAAAHVTAQRAHVAAARAAEDEGMPHEAREHEAKETEHAEHAEFHEQAGRLAKFRETTNEMMPGGDAPSGLVDNPFVSEAQRRACYAKDDPNWDCDEWNDKTTGKLPKKATANYAAEQDRDENGRFAGGADKGRYTSSDKKSILGGTRAGEYELANRPTGAKDYDAQGALHGVATPWGQMTSGRAAVTEDLVGQAEDAAAAGDHGTAAQHYTEAARVFDNVHHDPDRAKEFRDMAAKHAGKIKGATFNTYDENDDEERSHAAKVLTAFRNMTAPEGIRLLSVATREAETAATRNTWSDAARDAAIEARRAKAAAASKAAASATQRAESSGSAANHLRASDLHMKAAQAHDKAKGPDHEAAAESHRQASRDHANFTAYGQFARNSAEDLQDCLADCDNDESCVEDCLDEMETNAAPTGNAAMRLTNRFWNGALRALGLVENSNPEGHNQYTGGGGKIPQSIKHEGKTLYHTGKVGTVISPKAGTVGEATAEYEHHDEQGNKTGFRAWRTASGKVTTDNEAVPNKVLMPNKPVPQNGTDQNYEGLKQFRHTESGQWLPKGSNVSSKQVDAAVKAGFKHLTGQEMPPQDDPDGDGDSGDKAWGRFDEPTNDKVNKDEEKDSLPLPRPETRNSDSQSANIKVDGQPTGGRMIDGLKTGLPPRLVDNEPWQDVQTPQQVKAGKPFQPKQMGVVNDVEGGERMTPAGLMPTAETGTGMAGSPLHIGPTAPTSNTWSDAAREAALAARRAASGRGSSGDWMAMHGSGKMHLKDGSSIHFTHDPATDRVTVTTDHPTNGGTHQTDFKLDRSSEPGGGPPAFAYNPKTTAFRIDTPKTLQKEGKLDWSGPARNALVLDWLPDQRLMEPGDRWDRFVNNAGQEKFLITGGWADPLWLAWNRDWPQDKRDKLADEDFAGPGQSFPIKTQTDVDAASHLTGKAANPDAVKAKVKSIAARKGLNVPDAWRGETQNQSAADMVTNCPKCGARMSANAKGGMACNCGYMVKNFGNPPLRGKTVPKPGTTAPRNPPPMTQPPAPDGDGDHDDVPVQGGDQGQPAGQQPAQNPIEQTGKPAPAKPPATNREVIPMTLSEKQRREAVGYLTVNCACDGKLAAEMAANRERWTDDHLVAEVRKVDAVLKKARETTNNALKSIPIAGRTLVVNAQGRVVLNDKSESSNSDGQQYIPGKKVEDADDGSDHFNKKLYPSSDDKYDGLVDDSLQHDMEIGKPVAEKTALNAFYARKDIPDEVKEVVRNGQEAVQTEKARIVELLVANFAVNDPDRQLEVNALMRLDLPALRRKAKGLPRWMQPTVNQDRMGVQPLRPAPTVQPEPVYGGAPAFLTNGGHDGRVDNEDDGDILPLVTMNLKRKDEDDNVEVA